MFVVSLLALVKTLAVTMGLFLFLILVFRDNLDPLNHGDDIFIYIFLGLFLWSLGGIIYVFAILLPMYYADRKKMWNLQAADLFSRHAPIIAVIVSFFSAMTALIAGKEGLQEGMVQGNIFLAYVMALIGLLIFELQVKQAIEKLKPETTNPSIITRKT